MPTLITYNLNGFRAAVKKGFLEWLEAENPDIVCLQEVKATPKQLEKELAFLANLGYESYFFPAQKAGYSGVAILTKISPKAVVYGMDNPKYDAEGRVLRADFDTFSVVSVYMPSGTSGDSRQDFKYEWLEDFTQYIEALRKTIPNLILSGDYNICHKPIDINFPKKHEKMTGFLPQERAWFDDFINLGWVDAFRVFSQAAEQYTWWSYRSKAREKNLGWRIDYHLVTDSFAPRLQDCQIRSEAVHSDHCPVWLSFV
ncbi:exodeoxyribonuclease III [Hugenholtzia roseola]|uniref:exodeoxyribonuclease III n=1 Tax=Hugenholtzia roseola TaxID=1002 RepID=UPI00041E5925|nr:exodeoxyribonuclease III [Hugenholtzia roseola]